MMKKDQDRERKRQNEGDTQRVYMKALRLTWHDFPYAI